MITDAEPLVWLRSMKHPKGKYATWVMEFNCYDFDVHHRPGKDHWWADSFSRLAKLMPESRPGETVDFDENKLTNDSELQALDCGQRVRIGRWSRGTTREPLDRSGMIDMKRYAEADYGRVPAETFR